MGIQSRMRAKGLDGGRLDFVYVDSTNVQSPGDHRMTRLVLSFPDPGRLVQEWTGRDGDRDSVSRFEFRRRR